MGYPERKSLYEQIENQRDRHLIVYVTSSRPNASGVMASDVILEFARQIEKIPKDNFRSEFRTNGIISANRKADLNIALNVINIASKWYFKENKES